MKDEKEFWRCYWFLSILYTNQIKEEQSESDIGWLFDNKNSADFLESLLESLEEDQDKVSRYWNQIRERSVSGIYDTCPFLPEPTFSRKKIANEIRPNSASR